MRISFKDSPEWRVADMAPGTVFYDLSLAHEPEDFYMRLRLDGDDGLKAVNLKSGQVVEFASDDKYPVADAELVVTGAL